MVFDLKNLAGTDLTQLGERLSQGEIAVIPTDTQYGIVTSASRSQSVERIYQLRKRSGKKPMILLISQIEDIEKMGIQLNHAQKTLLAHHWPNPLSVIIPVENPKLEYLHRGMKSLAFRLPQPGWLQTLLQASGPLVAPSANFEGESPATTLEEARKYFGSQIDFYIDYGKLQNPPSTIIKMTGDQVEIIRQGAYLLSHE